MKKKVFRERYAQEDTMEKFIKDIVKKSLEKSIDDLNKGKEIIEEVKEGELKVLGIKKPSIKVEEEPKKRGRKKSVKSDK